MPDKIFHRSAALAIAIVLTLGAPALADTGYAPTAFESIAGKGLAFLKETKLLGSFTRSFSAQLAAVSSIPLPQFSFNLAKFPRTFNSNLADLIRKSPLPVFAAQSTAMSAGPQLFAGDTPSNPIPSSSGGATDPVRSNASNGAGKLAQASATVTDTPLESRGPLTGQAQPAIPVPSTGIQNPVASLGGIFEDILALRLQELENKLSSRISALSASTNMQATQTYQVIAQTNKINRLDGVAIATATITGSSFSGTTASATDVSATNFTAANATSTNLFSTTASSTNLFSTSAALGILTANSATLSNATTTNLFSSSATSTNLFSTNASTTNATSTNMFSVLGHFTTGVIDTLSSTLATITSLTATNLTATNATTTNATSTNFYASTLGAVTASTTDLTFQTAVGGNATTTNLFSTTASSTNLFSQLAALGSLSVSGTFSQTGLISLASGFLSNASSTITSGLFSMNGGASTTNITASGIGYFTTASSTNLFSSSATSTNLFSTNFNLGVGTLGNATTTNLFSTTASSTNLYAQAASVGTLAASGATTLSSTLDVTGLTTLGNLSLTAGTTTNFFSTTASSTNLFSQLATIGSLTLGNALGIASGGTATTTQVTNGVNYFDGTRITSGTALTYDGTKLTAPFASSTALSVSGTGYFGTASTTNLTVSSLTANRVPYITTAGAFTDSANLTFDGTTLTAANLTSSGNVSLGNATTTNLFSTTASSTNLYSQAASVGTLAAGGAATLSSTLGVTGLTTLGNLSLTAGTTTNFFATTASSTNLFSQLATLGTLTLGNALAVTSGGTGVTTSTGTGSVVLSASPTLTGTIAGASQTLSGTLGVSGLSTLAGFLSNASSTITSGLFTMNGGASTTNLTASGTGYFGLGQFTNTSGTTTIASGQGFTVGSSQLVVQQGSGNVGLGTTAPGAKLHSVGEISLLVGNGTTNNDSKVGAIAAQQYATANTPFGLMASVVDGADNLVSIGGGRSIVTAATIVNFYTAANNNTTTGTERMRITSTGNVGIGTTAPASLLSVGGAGAAGQVLSTYQPSAGEGTISVSAAGTTVTGTGTTFAKTFMLGDTITANGETHTIQAIASDTSMTTDAWTGTFSGVYTTENHSNWIQLKNGSSYWRGSGLPTTGAYRALVMSPTITFTGTASPVFGAIQISPTITAAATTGNFAPSAYSSAITATVSGSGSNIIGNAALSQAQTLSITTGAVSEARPAAIQANLNIGASNTQNWPNTDVNAPAAFRASVGSVAGASGTISNISLFSGALTQGAAQTITNAYGLRVYQISTTAGSTITNAIGAGIYAVGFTSSGGTVTNRAYLMLSGTQNAAPTGNYAIYDETGYNSYFAGNVGIGTTTPLSGLQVVAAISGAPTTVGVHLGRVSNFAQLQLFDTAGGIVDFSDAAGEDADFRIIEQSGRLDIGAGTTPTGMTISSTGNVGIGDTTPTEGKVTIHNDLDPGTSPAALDITMPGASAGTAVAQYGIKIVANSYNNATAMYGVYSKATQNTQLISYGVYGETGGSATQNSYGVYGKGNQLDTNGGGYSYGVYGTAVSAGANGTGRTYAGAFDNQAATGAAAVGVYANVVSGATSVKIISGALGGNEQFAVASNGNVTNTNNSYGAISDARDKNLLGPMRSVLGDFRSLQLEEFQYLSEIAREGTTTAPTRFGVIAQQAQTLFPWIINVGVNENGREQLTANYMGLSVVTAKALQELDLNLESLASTTPSEMPEAQSFAERFFSNIFARITSWLADAANGVGDSFAKVFHAGEKICVDDQCLTRDDVRALLALAHSQTAAAAGSGGSNSDAGGDTSSGGVTSASSTPVIQINGNNPATITVGDTFGDLGAIITGPTEADTNLGIYTFLDGVAVDTINLDTSTAGTHTIDYVAENSAGTATSTRTVIVEAPASSPQVEAQGGDTSSQPSPEASAGTEGGVTSDTASTDTTATSTDVVADSATTTPSTP